MKPSLIRFVFTLYLSALTVFCATAQELDFVKTMGGAGDDGLYDLVTDNDKNIYVIGWFSITCDLDPGAGTSLMASNGNRDITLAKYDSV
ncbi:MAG: hypothetical protein JNL88_10890, partial [Bacteroidia bacterium]|nr:hypothetical protein [Bacteroidia bacterium]